MDHGLLQKIEDFVSTDSRTTKLKNSKRLLCHTGEDGCMAIYVLDTLQDERITELDSDRSRHRLINLDTNQTLKGVLTGV
jgi:hypothetical protein